MTTAKYGPQTEQVAALIDRLHQITGHDVYAIHAARRWADPVDDAREVAAAAASAAGRMIAMDDADDAVYAAVSSAEARAILVAGRFVFGDWEGAAACASDAALGLVVRDLVDGDTYRLLTAPVAAAFGGLHPDDKTEEGS